MEAHDIGAVMAGLPQWVSEDDKASFWIPESFNQGMFWVGRFSGQSPWERHPDGDELLHVLEGEVEVTVWTDDGLVHTTVPAGSVFVVPRGLWHRQIAWEAVTQVGATPGTTEHSTVKDGCVTILR